MLNLEDAYKLRYKVYVEEKEYIREKNSLKIETDKYDADAIHICVYRKDKLAGYCRLVFKDSKLPLLDSAQISIKENSAEISRLIVDKDYRNDSSVLVELFCRMYKASKEQNIKNWYCLMEVSLARILRRFGCKFKVIAKVDNILSVYFAAISDLELSVPDDSQIKISLDLI